MQRIQSLTAAETWLDNEIKKKEYYLTNKRRWLNSKKQGISQITAQSYIRANINLCICLVAKVQRLLDHL